MLYFGNISLSMLEGGGNAQELKVNKRRSLELQGLWRSKQEEAKPEQLGGNGQCWGSQVQS